jgi:recombination protein RecT
MSDEPKAEQKALTRNPQMERVQGIIQAEMESMLTVQPDYSPAKKEKMRDRWLRVAMAAFSRNPKLLTCTPGSIVVSLRTAAEFGLEPCTPLGYCYLIPYDNRKKGFCEAQFQMGYQGLIELARRAGVTIRVGVRHQNDDFYLDEGLAPNLKHVRCDGDRGDVVGYWAIAHISGGMPLMAYMTVAECLKHAERYSRAYQYHLKGQYSDTPWKEEPGTQGFDSMALKTVILRACKYAPKSISDRFADAIEVDEYEPPEDAPQKPRKPTVDDLKARFAPETIDTTATAEETPPEPPFKPEPPKPEPPKPGKKQAPKTESDRESLLEKIGKLSENMNANEFDAVCAKVVPDTAPEFMNLQELDLLVKHLENVK